MKNSEGTIIYVGKSVNLKSRVSSYFQEGGNLTYAKKIMVSAIEQIDIIEVRNEIEALVLETNLIKEYRPKYNILMKDDKNLGYITITNEIVPEVFRTRQKTKNGKWYGPFPPGTPIALTAKILKRLFKIRSCRMKFGGDSPENISILHHAGKSAPCLDYYIGICPGPCLLTPESLRQHEDNVNQLARFLGGEKKSILDELEKKMLEHAKKLEFEAAKEIKDQLQVLSGLFGHQIARDGIDGDAEVVYFLEKYSRYFLGVCEIRGGQITGLSQQEILAPKESDSIQIFSSALEQFLVLKYVNQELGESTKLILSPEQCETEILQLGSLFQLKIEIPQIGPKKEFLQFVSHNLVQFAYKQEMERLSEKPLSKEIMERILEKLGYESKSEGKKIFECYDVSHTDGHFTVASRSVMVNGKMETKLYKKYKIKSIADGKIDDFASHKEIMYRRGLEGFSENNFPDLIIIDGGKGQLSHALEGLELAKKEYKGDEFRIPPICSIAKRFEWIYIPESSDPVEFQHDSNEMGVFVALRDEAHRFAITFNREKRTKAMKKNILEDLPGFGPATRKKILKKYGSIQALEKIHTDELSDILTQKQITTLLDHGIILE